MRRLPPPAAPFATVRPPRLERVPVDPDVRAQLRSRADACELCSVPLRGDRWEAHHRKPRSHGRDDRLSNLLALCRVCHRRVHGHPAWSYSTGFLVHATDDPAAMPVALYQRGWVELDNEGGRWPLPDDEPPAVTS